MTRTQQLPQLALLQHIEAALKAHPMVRAAFLRGSFYSGQPDLYSDLDVFVVLEPSPTETVFDQGHALLATVDEILWISEISLATPCLRVLFRGPLRVDLFLMTPATLPHYSGCRVLYDPEGLLKNSVLTEELVEPLQIEHVAALCDEFWWNIFSSVSQIKRDHLWLALHVLDLCRANVTQIMRWYRNPEQPFEHYTDLEQHLTPTDQQALTQTLATYDPRSIAAALLFATDAFDPIAREVAARVGTVYPAGLAQIVKQHFLCELWGLIATGPAISA